MTNKDSDRDSEAGSLRTVSTPNTNDSWTDLGSEDADKTFATDGGCACQDYVDSHDWEFAVGEDIYQDMEVYTVKRRVYDADSDSFLYWVETPEGSHSLKTETVVEEYYTHESAGETCPDCGFTDHEDHFDDLGMDLMCPHCGNVGVR